eukprot:1939278-Prymnesium_polylepis.1
MLRERYKRKNVDERARSSLSCTRMDAANGPSIWGKSDVKNRRARICFRLKFEWSFQRGSGGSGVMS